MQVRAIPFNTLNVSENDHGHHDFVGIEIGSMGTVVCNYLVRKFSNCQQSVITKRVDAVQSEVPQHKYSWIFTVSRQAGGLET